MSSNSNAMGRSKSEAIAPFGDSGHLVSLHEESKIIQNHLEDMPEADRLQIDPQKLPTKSKTVKKTKTKADQVFKKYTDDQGQELIHVESYLQRKNLIGRRFRHYYILEEANCKMIYTKKKYHAGK